MGKLAHLENVREAAVPAPKFEWSGRREAPIAVGLRRGICLDYQPWA